MAESIVWAPTHPWDNADMTRCRAAVWYRWHDHQCPRAAVTEPDENGVRWCKQHDPAAVKAREGASNERQALRNRARGAEAKRAMDDRRYATFGRQAEAILHEMLDDRQIDREGCFLSGEHTSECDRCSRASAEEEWISAALALLEAPQS